MEQIQFVGNLTVVTCWCGTRHAVPEELADVQLRQHRDGEKQTGIYCPLGHSHIKAGDGEAARLRKELAKQQSEHDQTKAKLRDTEKRRQVEKAAKTRLTNRVANGVCPCCNRSFKNLHRHMQGQHPEFEAKK